MKNLVKTTLLVSIAFVLVIGMVPSSASANDSQAGVIIDTGEEVKTACITFRGDSISGAQALELANAQPKFQSFGSTGNAVCSLCGVGCPTGNTCLTCMGSTFWNYFRSTDSNTGFTLSGVGAGSSVVRNGDVEGWKFGVGQKPPYLSFNTICGIKVSSETPSSPAVKKSLENRTDAKQSKQSKQITQSTSLVVEGDKAIQANGDKPAKVLGKTLSREDKPSSKDTDKGENSRSSWASIFMYSMIFVGIAGAGYFVFLNTTKNQKT